MKNLVWNSKGPGLTLQKHRVDETFGSKKLEAVVYVVMPPKSGIAGARPKNKGR